MPETVVHEVMAAHRATAAVMVNAALIEQVERVEMKERGAQEFMRPRLSNNTLQGGANFARNFYGKFVINENE